MNPMYTPLSALYDIFLEHPGISSDSRNIAPGDLFFALKGDNFDGNAFTATALEKGAAYAITDDPRTGGDNRYLLVEDTLKTLQDLASLHRSHFTFPVIGITGTNGKTTTKELIAAVLSKKYHCLSTQGNLNNHIGVPLTLLRIRPDTGIAVVEMGANHPGEIGALCRIARPDFGIITNIGKAHLAGFGSFEGVIAAKRELYDHIRHEGKMLFVNLDDDLLVSLADGIPQVAYSRTKPSPCRGTLVSADPFVVMDIHTGGGLHLSSHLFGGYNADNILAAVCIGDHFGVPASLIKEAIEGYVPSNNRSQVVRGKKNLLIMDAYNANPGSMHAALQNFAQSALPGKMVILGDMLELGAESENEHREIIRMVAELGFTNAVFIGPVFSSLLKDSPVEAFETSDAAKEFLLKHEITGRTILVKGSRGTRLEQVEDAL